MPTASSAPPTSTWSHWPIKSPNHVRSRSLSSSRGAGDREALEIAIVENVQRADLNALEEAAGYAQGSGADYGYSHGNIARVVGKSRSHAALLRRPNAANFTNVQGLIPSLVTPCRH